MSESGKKKIAVFASGNGTNLQALIDHCASGDIQGEIVAVVSNKKHAYAITRAKLAHIEPLVFEPENFQSRTVMCAKTAKALKERSVDLICLAGYMLKLEPCLIRTFPNRIINIHPALLPKYGGQGMFGHHVHEAVIKAKETESGCTVHVVDEIYDHGPVLAQARVSIEPTDTPETLAQKIHAEEHKVYVSVLRDICSGKINLDVIARNDH
jgi:phosphoribosylglycinamide formyltransferase 1